jgi:hypothetical protein
MKKIILSCLAVISVILSYAQTPQAFKYQAVVRDNSGEILQNQTVGIRISIHDASVGGTIIYQETFNQTTNEFGLINLEIGNGTPNIGTFTGIDWSINSKFLEIEIDPSGGNTYVSIGTSELLSVPYALYSERSMNAVWEKSGNEIFYNDGNVGIGTSDPAGSLDVRGAGTDDGVVINLGNSDLSHKLTLFGGRETDPNPFLLWTDGDPFRLATDAGGFTERMRITSDGKVGIGTTDPITGLHLKGSGWPDAFLCLQSEDAGDAGIRLYEGDTVKWHFYNNAVADKFMIINSDFSKAVFIADQTSGNVGIGTTTPDATLHVDDRIRVGVFPYGELIHEGGGTGFIINSHSGGGWADIHFQTNGTTKMFLESLGNLGLGTLSPEVTLHVETGSDIELDGGGYLVLGSTTARNIGMDNNEIMARNNGLESELHLNHEGGNVLISAAGSGKLGIGTSTPTCRLDVQGIGFEEAISANNVQGSAIQATSTNGIGVRSISSSGYGIYAKSTFSFAGYFEGDVHVSGYLSKGGGSFVIDHPLDPENKLLRHNFVESPENLLIYRGKAELNVKGETVVKMPDYFKALTMENEATVALTSIGKPFLTGYEWDVDFASFKIFGEPEREVSWVVYADRDDPVIHELGRPVEEIKGGKRALCKKGELLYPKAYGYPESMRRDNKMKTLVSENK